MGGKAATLSQLLAAGFPVPEGAVVFTEPQQDADFRPLLQWWKEQGAFPVAARSSASGEDSADFSYAGQFVTVLNVESENGLKKALTKCFQSVHRKASRAYASHFKCDEIPMHVLVQRMIHAQYSGVFFSQDPRAEKKEWLVEVVEGLGEQLVSGQTTPYRFSKHHRIEIPGKWQDHYLQEILHWGQAIEKELGYLVDMEWAIDKDGHFWILQSRPITTLNSEALRRETLTQEWKRVQQESVPDSVWDGHSFAEWTGIPTEFTYDIWRRTFLPGQAFDLALREIGYEGVTSTGLLNRIFGRAYLNLKVMESVYFGDSPYRLAVNPRPHLEFDFSRLTLGNLMRAPKGIMEMAQVAWTVQTDRRTLAQKALERIQSQDFASLDAFALYAQVQNLPKEQHLQGLQKLVEVFSRDCLQSTFLITLLIESTTQGLLAILSKDLGAEKAAASMTLLAGAGLETLASEMQQEFSEIQGSTERWQKFLSKYGHRGAGEMDLSHPRWLETEMPTFKGPSSFRREKQKADEILQNLLSGLSSLRRPVFEQEWRELQRLLQVREQIKMQLMKPYAQIRWLLLKLGQELSVGMDILWLTLDEVASVSADVSSTLGLLKERKQKALFFKSVHLPMTFSLQDLQAVLQEGEAPKAEQAASLVGVALAPGLSVGRVHIVNDPENEDFESWPADTVLVAEATDPGWTPLFERAKAVIVERGGVLSHCAIVAREMGLVAVGEIRGATEIFKEGEYVWVDGNHGTIRRSH